MLIRNNGAIPSGSNRHWKPKRLSLSSASIDLIRSSRGQSTRENPPSAGSSRRSHSTDRRHQSPDLWIASRFRELGPARISASLSLWIRSASCQGGRGPRHVWRSPIAGSKDLACGTTESSRRPVAIARYQEPCITHIASSRALRDQASKSPRHCKGRSRGGAKPQGPEIRDGTLLNSHRFSMTA